MEEKLTEIIRRLGRSVMGVKNLSNQQQHDYLPDWQITAPGKLKGGFIPRNQEDDIIINSMTGNTQHTRQNPDGRRRNLQLGHIHRREKRAIH